MKAVITGANRGIGLEFCRQLAQRGDEVIAVCRKASPELSQLGVTIIDAIDVATEQGVLALQEKLKGQKIDLLINNAGILRSSTLDNLNIDAIREQFEVNALGPLRITAALVDNLPKGSKVGIVTSRMGSVDDNSSGGTYGYRMSKAAVNIAGKSLAIDLEPNGVSIALLHPGYVRTDMTGNSGLIDADESARGLIAIMDNLGLETSGRFWHTNGEELPW